MKDCQAKLHSMTKVTPWSIAYAAVHVSFGHVWLSFNSSNLLNICCFLSNYHDWRINNSIFLLSDFFWTITNLFKDDPTSKWAIETLDWFNKYAFPYFNHVVSHVLQTSLQWNCSQEEDSSFQPNRLWALGTSPSKWQCYPLQSGRWERWHCWLWAPWELK